MAARRSTSRRMLVAFATVTVAVGAVLAPAGGAHADTAVHHVRGVTVSGTSSTRDGCLATTVHVGVSREELRTADEVSHELFYARQVVDECTGEQVSYVLGHRPTLEVFDVGPGHRSVRVVAEIPLEDPFTDELTGEVVTMDNTWTARGRPERSTDHVRNVVPGQTSAVSSSRRLTVHATVSGTVPLHDGDIDRLSAVSVLVSHT